jgi:hypothetical protein
MPPKLTGPTAQVARVAPGDTVALTLEATDPESDTLTYAWRQIPAEPSGTFSSTTEKSPRWTAPTVSAPRSFTLEVTVKDAKGATSLGQVSVSVVPPAVPGNTAPTLTERPSATPSTVARKKATTLAVTATDGDGDSLTYSWEQTSPASPAGTFSSTSAARPTWTAPDVRTSGTFTLRVTVSDGRGGSVQDTVAVSVQAVNQPPEVSDNITAPETLTAGTIGTFSLSATDPDGDPLTYSWQQDEPALHQGTWVGDRTLASAEWYSPVIPGPVYFTLSVRVTDGRSDPVARNVRFSVTVPRYGTDIQPIWRDAGCTGCHPSNGYLTLTAGDSYSSLVNSYANVAACNTLRRVLPLEPDNSVLVRKLEGTTCGSRMPRNNPTYFDQNPILLVRVRSWIAAGAFND